MKLKKSLALILVLSMLLITFVGCGGSADSDTPLVIAETDFSEKFSSFFAEAVPDQEIVDMVNTYLVQNDRNGEVIMNGASAEGEVMAYNGTDYTYYTPANIEITENADGTMDIKFMLRDDLVFSDGEPVTADDIIFSYYVYCDPTYDGAASLGSLPIEGLKEYKNNVAPFYAALMAAGADNTDFSYWTEEQQNDFFNTVLPAAGETFAQEIVDYCVAELGTTTVAEAASNWAFSGLADDATAADFFDLMVESYEGDLQSLSSTESAGSSLLELMGDEWCKTITTGESAPNITGIQKIDDYTVNVHLTTVDASAIYNLGVHISPLHYYGDAEAYDFDNNNFGFPKGDLSGVKSHTNAPVGMGAYKFIKYENKIVYLEANETYYKGEPATKYVQWKTSTDSDMVPGIVQGTVDIAQPSASKTTLEQIAAENDNGEISGNVLNTMLVPYNGYGYIGINSKNVCVNNDPGSEASKNYRKAIATVLAVYRDVTVDSYYGDAAEVINYPISNASWAAPKKSDADYHVAFSLDANGNEIYNESMSADERYAAALEASLGFFEAAGYTITDGKITAAPAGGKLEQMVYVAGDGEGNHPSYGLLISAAEALNSIGFTLTVNDIADANIMWDAINAEEAELYCAAWQTTIDPDMYQTYHSNGGSVTNYSIRQPELDNLVMEGRSNTDVNYRKAIYKEALDYIVDYAVELPVYQRNDMAVVSTERVNIDTLVKDPTSYYTWQNEVDKIAMN